MRKPLKIVLALVAVLVTLWFVAGFVRVPMQFDAEGVTSLQLNGGTLTLVDGNEPSLTASIPLRALPVLMARRTEGLLEVGGFDDSDPRVLVAFLFPFGVPATVEAVRWELTAPELERVTVAGGALVADGYASDALFMDAISGSAELRDIEIGTLAMHAQDPGRITVSGHVGTFGLMNSGGTVDSNGLEYDQYDRQVIVDYFEE